MNQLTMAELDTVSAGLSWQQNGFGVSLTFASLVIGIAGIAVGLAGAGGAVAGEGSALNG